MVSVDLGFTATSWVRASGALPPRWVLVVRDSAGEEHGVAVAPQVWDAHEVGDVIAADNPLVDVD